MNVPSTSKYLRRSPAVIVSLLALVSLGLMSASASQSTSTISGCVNKTTGALRIVSKCSSKERLIQWDSPLPTKQYRDSIDSRDLPMTSKTNSKGRQRDVLLAVDTSQMPTGAYDVWASLSGKFTTATVTSNHEYVWCYFQPKVLYDSANFAANDNGYVTLGYDLYDQGYYREFILHLSSPLDVSQGLGIIYLVCVHNVGLTGVVGFMAAHQSGTTASLPLASTPA